MSRGSISKVDELTDKQRIFAIAYASNGGNNTQASKVAGIHRKTGENYLTNPAVKSYLQELSLTGGNNILNVTQLQEIATKVLTDDTLYEEHPNFQTGGVIRTKISWATKQKWFDSLNRMQGNFIQTIDVNHNVEIKTIEEVKKTGFRLGQDKDNIIEAKDFEWIEVDEEEEEEVEEKE